MDIRKTINTRWKICSLLRFIIKEPIVTLGQAQSKSYTSYTRACFMSLRPHAEAGTNLKVYSVKSEWKALVDTVGIKSADLKDKFLLQSFAAFRTAQMK